MSSTTTRPPRSPGAQLADAVADLAEVDARLATLTGPSIRHISCSADLDRRAAEAGEPLYPGRAVGGA